MKYKVPIYKLQSNEEILIGRVIVAKTSLGVYEVITKRKIHIFSGMINLSEYNDKKGLFNLYVKSEDINRHNLVFTEKSKQIKIPTSKLYELKNYQKEHEKLLQLIKHSK